MCGLRPTASHRRCYMIHGLALTRLSYELSATPCSLPFGGRPARITSVPGCRLDHPLSSKPRPPTIGVASTTFLNKPVLSRPRRSAGCGPASGSAASYAGAEPPKQRGTGTTRARCHVNCMKPLTAKSLPRPSGSQAFYLVGLLPPFPCAWGRAVLPAGLWDIGPVPRDDDQATLAADASTHFERIAGASRRVFTDGAGPPPFLPTSLPVTGGGLCALDATEGDTTSGGIIRLRAIAVATAPTPLRQTVARAELWASTFAFGFLPNGGRIDVDASYVVGCAAASDAARLRRLQSLSQDIWEVFFERLGGPSDISVCKVQAHRQSAALAMANDDLHSVQAHRQAAALVMANDDLHSFAGNFFADAMAGGLVRNLIRATPAYE